MAPVALQATSSSTKPTPSPKVDDAFVERVRVSLEARILKHHLSQSQIATEANVSTAVISQFLNRKYPGNVIAVAKGLDHWLLLRQGPQEDIDDTIYIDTQNSLGIAGKLALAHGMRSGVLVYGIAGIGKSRTARQYVHDHPLSTIYIFVTPPIKSVYALLAHLGSVLGISSGLSVQRIEQEIEAKLIGTGRMLIFDEAQRLMYNALETIMGLAEKTKFSMALITDTRFWEKITSGKDRGNYERLISRLTVKCEVLDHPAADDVTKIAKQFLSDLDLECIDYLTDIAASKNGLRAVIDTCRTARTLIGADKIAEELLQPAIQYLRLANASRTAPATCPATSNERGSA